MYIKMATIKWNGNFMMNEVINEIVILLIQVPHLHLQLN